MNVPDPLTATFILFITRLCLALFFLLSAIGKFRHYRLFIQGTIDYQILPKWAAIILGYVLPWIELSIGLGLLLGIALPIVSIGSALLLISFIIAIAINLLRNRRIHCNCYGIANTATINSGMIARNTLLLLLAIFIIARWPEINSFDTWIIFWQSNLHTVSSATSALLFGLLLMFLVVLVYLVEWGFYIHYRISSVAS